MQKIHLRFKTVIPEGYAAIGLKFQKVPIDSSQKEVLFVNSLFCSCNTYVCLIFSDEIIVYVIMIAMILIFLLICLMLRIKIRGRAQRSIVVSRNPLFDLQTPSLAVATSTTNRGKTL